MLSRSYSLNFLLCARNVGRLSIRDIFMCNLDFKDPEEQLRCESAQIGEVERASIMRRQLPASRDLSGFVEMANSRRNGY